MNQQMMQDFKNWFHNYVGPFKASNGHFIDGIEIKIIHSLKVCEEIVALAKALSLSEEQTAIAEIMGLFHDIGRFEQYSHHSTYRDQQGADHGVLGVEVLKRNDVLKNIPERIQEIIYRSILYHNQARVPDVEDGEVRFYARLLRDADKLDIYRVVTEYYYSKKNGSEKAVNLGLPDSPHISDIVLDELSSGKIISTRHLKSLNDLRLLQIGWVYDLNFRPSFEALIQRRYIELIRDVLPPDKRIDNIVKQIQKYIQEAVAQQSLSIQEKVEF